MRLFELVNVLSEGNNSIKLDINESELRLDDLRHSSNYILSMNIERMAIMDNSLLIYLEDSIANSQLEDYGYSFEAGV